MARRKPELAVEVVPSVISAKGEVPLLGPNSQRIVGVPELIAYSNV